MNSRLDGIQAAVLRCKLRRLDRWNEERRAAAANYRRLLEGLPLALPAVRADAEAVFHQFVIRTAERERIRETLTAAGIGSAIHYPLPVHLHPAYREPAPGWGSFPVAEACAAQVLSLPMFPTIRGEEQQAVAEALRRSFRRGSPES
jgi:dTDP-4-amino-4,6-dideoxygalactose transaminase